MWGQRSCRNLSPRGKSLKLISVYRDSKPTVDGAYRIKVFDQDLAIESVPGKNPGLKLAPPSTSNNKQKVSILFNMRVVVVCSSQSYISGTLFGPQTTATSGQ